MRGARFSRATDVPNTKGMDMARVSRVRRMFRNGRARRLREQSALSVRELAGMVGVDPSTLSRWERGETTPGVAGARAWVSAMERLGMRL